MRVLNVMLGGKRGGIEQAAVNYAEALRAQGHDVTTVIRKDAFVAQALAEGGFKVLPIALPYRWNPLAARRIQRAMRQTDIVLLHGNRAAELTVVDKKKMPPIVAVVHSRFFNVEPHFSALIVLSQKMADTYVVSGIPTYFIPNLVHIPDVSPHPAFRAIPVVGTMGRMSEEKGMDLFIEAIGLLRQRGVMVEGVIGGSGGIEPQLRAQAANNPSIRFAGWVGDKKEFFQSLDIFCLSSRTETFSITLLEAMAHGVPSVATKCGGPSEIIQEGLNGLLAEVDAGSLADTLQRALVDPVATARMGLTGRENVGERYDAPVIAARLDKCLREIVGGQGASRPYLEWE